MFGNPMLINLNEITDLRLFNILKAIGYLTFFGCFISVFIFWTLILLILTDLDINQGKCSKNNTLERLHACIMFNFDLSNHINSPLKLKCKFYNIAPIKYDR